MKGWVSRAILLLVLALIGIWAWRLFFPDPAHVIRRRMLELAKTASFSGKEGLVAKAFNSETLGGFFDNDVEVVVDVPGRSQQTFNGRAELVQAAMGVRSALGSLTIDFIDINVSVAPDKESAVVGLTGKAKVPGERDFFVQELKFTLKKTGREWLIKKLETIKTLSQIRAVSPRWRVAAA
jgi:hypothetical protein